MRFIGSFAWMTDSSLNAGLSACKGFNVLPHHFQCLFSPNFLHLIYNNLRNLIFIGLIKRAWVLVHTCFIYSNYYNNFSPFFLLLFNHFQAFNLTCYSTFFSCIQSNITKHKENKRLTECVLNYFPHLLHRSVNSKGLTINLEPDVEKNNGFRTCHLLV